MSRRCIYHMYPTASPATNEPDGKVCLSDGYAGTLRVEAQHSASSITSAVLAWGPYLISEYEDL